MPQFTIAKLFLVTSAVAIGVAVSQEPEVEAAATWGFIYVGDTPLSQSLYSFGVVLLIYELIRQAKNVTLPEDLGSSKPRFAIRYRAWLRWGIAAALSGLLLLKLLLNRKLLPEVERQEISQLYGELWPDLVMLVVVFFALRLMLDCHPARSRAPSTNFIFSIVIAVGVLGCGFYVVIDRLLVTNLVHIAIDNVEKSQPARFQRADAFPNHRMEGFQTFWRSTQMMCVVLSALGIVLLSTMLKSRWVLLGVWAIFVACLLGGANYCWWFVTSEFPRLNPDLASQPVALLRSDAVAGALLVLGLGVVCGYQLARRTSNAASLPIGALQKSGILAIGAGSIGVAIGYEWLAALSSSVSSPWWGGFTTRSWVGFLKNFGQILLYPELMIPFAVCLSAWVVVWRYFKPPHPTSELPIFDGWHFAGYAVATIAWVLVAIPTFAIFGFCYWLGPWVL
ncbi:MAG: hypothetical protein ACR2NM_15600 [Bythopirellula sp.]